MPQNSGKNKNSLRELGSYILAFSWELRARHDKLKPYGEPFQLKAFLTIKRGLGSCYRGGVRSPYGAVGSPCSGKKRTNKHKHFGRDGLRDKQEPSDSLGQMGPLPGTKWDVSLGQTGLSVLNSTVKSLFCPVCPWDGWGFVPGTSAPKGPSEICLCVFCLLPDTAKLRIWTLRFWVFRAQDCLPPDRCSVGTRHAFFLSF